MKPGTRVTYSYECIRRLLEEGIAARVSQGVVVKSEHKDGIVLVKWDEGVPFPVHASNLHVIVDTKRRG